VLNSRREKLFTVSEAANILGVTETYIRRLIHEGRMSATRIGRRVWLVPESEVEKFREPPRVGRPRSRARSS